MLVHCVGSYLHICSADIDIGRAHGPLLCGPIIVGGHYAQPSLMWVELMLVHCVGRHPHVHSADNDMGGAHEPSLCRPMVVATLIVWAHSVIDGAHYLSLCGLT